MGRDVDKFCSACGSPGKEELLGGFDKTTGKPNSYTICSNSKCIHGHLHEFNFLGRCKCGHKWDRIK